MSGRRTGSPFPEGFDGPRPLRPSFAGRLAAEMATADVAEALAGLDDPRPLPPDLDARLEASLTVGAVVPVRLRRRLVRTVSPRPAPRSAAVGGRWSVAALLLIVLGMSTVAFVTGGGPVQQVAEDDGSTGVQVEGRFGPFASEAPDQRGSRPSKGSARVVPLIQAPGNGGVTVIGGSTGSDGTAAGGGLRFSGPDPDSPGPKPPYAFGPMDDEPLWGFGAFAGGPSAPSEPEPEEAPPPPPPLRIGVTNHDSEFAEGFRAYAELLNDGGGVWGRAFDLVAMSADKPARNVVAVVNGGATAIAGDLDARPLLEGPRVPESALHGDVFSFASVLERQAHLAVYGAFPEPPGPGSQAIVYMQDSPYGGRVGDALREALAARGGAPPISVTWDPENPVLIPGTAAFLALDAPVARTFLAEAKRQGYTPSAGIWGVESLFDTSLIGFMNGAVRVASPFAPASTAEMQAIESGAGQFSAETVAGWVSAKAVAVAVWRSGATTPTRLAKALHDVLDRWRTPFMPRYEVREGTTSRTPEAVTLRVEDDAFVPVGDFRRDPL